MRKKILIIEDDIDLCEILAESFEDEGYAVYHVQNGLTGKRELEENSYDFLLLDIKLPGLTGFDILKWLKHTDKKIKVIVMTGMPLNEEIYRLLHEDNPGKAELLRFADAVLNKPVRTEKLMDTLQKLDM